MASGLLGTEWHGTCLVSTKKSVLSDWLWLAMRCDASDVEGCAIQAMPLPDPAHQTSLKDNGLCEQFVCEPSGPRGADFKPCGQDGIESGCDRCCQVSSGRRRRMVTGAITFAFASYVEACGAMMRYHCFPRASRMTYQHATHARCIATMPLKGRLTLPPCCALPGMRLRLRWLARGCACHCRR